MNRNIATSCKTLGSSSRKRRLLASPKPDEKINRIIHYDECGIVKFHRGDKIHCLGRSFAESYTVNLGPEVKYHYPTRVYNG
uniref:Uncharacterized protein n=1 Tax=Magallana gigas TaxID=29159 RepID=K1R059_MAGGI